MEYSKLRAPTRRGWPAFGWALTGSEVDDDGLAELLEPYAGHRYRVQRLLELAGASRPRHGPRMAPRRHLPR